MTTGKGQIGHYESTSTGHPSPTVAYTPQTTEERLLKRLAMTLKQVRRESNITQDQVKQHTGVHLDKIESGKQNITLCTLKKVCDHCGISMSEFMKKLEKI